MMNGNQKGPDDPTGPYPRPDETPTEEAKRLLHESGPEPEERNPVTEKSAEGGWTQVNIHTAPPRATGKQIIEDLPSLPPNIHPFRDPRHNTLLRQLQHERMLVLTSYQERAAYAAAHALVNDKGFRDSDRKAMFPTRGRDKERSDLDLFGLANDEFYGENPHVLLIEITSQCPMLDSAFELGLGGSGKLYEALERHRSYVVLAINEALFARNAAAACISHHSVSYLRYLFARDLDDRAEELERRLLASIERGAGVADLQELYQRVAASLAEGTEAFEKLLLDLEQAHTLPVAERRKLLQPVNAQNVLRADSEIHRAAAFVATYFPEISQRDFDLLVLTLLGDSEAREEHTRQVLGRDGSIVTVTEQIRERWSDRWSRGDDQIFADCHLRTIVAADGSWVIDFTEPYLRRELRAHLERHFAWYVRRQCRILQDSGIFFSLDLSPAAVEALVRLFVDRAVVDPAGFGSVWLVDLVQGLKIQLKGEPPPDPRAALIWLLEKLAVEAQFRAHFYGRLALLVREMLDREALRPMVSEFFDYLIEIRQHDALLDVVLELARRLRFAPHFDPLVWTRRLLDQGSAPVRQRTVQRLLGLARTSGPRIYEFLAAIRGWLPEAGRPAERFSFSQRVALEFPFAYCVGIARTLPDHQYGEWPSRHALFYALPADVGEARRELTALVEWILDPRGAALEKADPSDPTRPAAAVRIGFAGELIEHWSWVLEGDGTNGSIEGLALFQTILDEVNARLGGRERVWLHRSWVRRQERYLAEAATAASAARTSLMRQRARLDQLKKRFSELPAQRETGGPVHETAGGNVS